MENFNKFILEVMRLEVKVVELYSVNGRYKLDITPEQVPNLDMPIAKYLWLKHYNQDKSNYEFELKELQQLALNDALALGPESIKLHIKRLEQVDERFSRFWKKYSEFCADFRNGTLSNTDLELKIYPFFNVSIKNKKRFGSVSQDFIHDLHDAVMFKSGFVGGLIKQLENALGISAGKNNTDDETRAKNVFSGGLRYLFRPKSNKDIADEYKYFRGEFIDEGPGYVSLIHNGITSKIYTPELATLLCGENIMLGVQGAGESVRLNRLEQDFFAKVYVKAYQEGVEQFKKEFPLTDEIVYGTHTEEYSKRLHRHFYHIECLGFSGGWNRLKHSYPRIITAKNVSDFGFYAGIISRAEEVINELNLWDRGFAKCSQQKQQSELLDNGQDKPQAVHAAKLFADLENEDWDKFEVTESEISNLRTYILEKKTRITDINLTLSELEYEEAIINSLTTQFIEAYPSNGLVFKHVPNLNEKYRRLLAESIAGLESIRKIAKARVEVKKLQPVTEHTNQAQPVKGKKGIKDNSISFEDCLKEKRLHPLLQKEYTNAEPKRIVPMLLALEEGVWIINGYKSNVTALHRALEYSFGKVGSRQAYADAFNKFNQVNTATEELKIKAEQKLISAMLDKLKENESTKDTC